MSSTPNQDLLKDLPLHILKQKAAVENQPNVSLTDWIKQAAQTYAAATDADSSNQTESAYYHYFKAAGILQLILKHPGFPTLKSQHPAEYRVYLEFTPKILASTERAKTLAEIIQNPPESSPPIPSSSKITTARRPIAGGISDRIKLFESSKSFERPPPSSPIIRDQSKIQHSSPTSSPKVDGRRQSGIPQPNGLPDPTPQPSFVSTALEAESTIRSGSAPPELTIENPSSGASDKPKLKHTIGNGLPHTNGDSPSHHQRQSNLHHEQIRTPSQFNQAFPALEDPPSNELTQSEDPLPSHPLPSLPSVPSTLPVKSFSPLPPPPQPFQVPSSDPDLDSQPTTYSVSDPLVNDITLGAGITKHSLPNRNSSPVGAPPPYPNFEIEALSRSPPREKSPFSRSPDLKSPHSLRGPRSIDWTLSSPKNPALNYSPLKPAQSSDTLPRLPSDANEILPATLIDYFRRSAACGFDTKVLFLDVRNREDFESCRIKSTDVICIEPLILSKNGGRGVSSKEIEDSLVISPKKEQALFQNRTSFDYVIIYDKRSVQLPAHRSKSELLYSSDPTEEAARLLLLLYLAIHKEEYIHQLKQPPMLLSGGIEGWMKVAGEVGVVGRGISVAPQQSYQTPYSTEITSSLNGISITLRQPLNADGDGNRNGIGNENLNGHTDLKRARRQVAVFQRDDSNLNQNHIIRSIPDLTTRPNGIPYHPPTSTSMPTFQPSRPPSYSSSSYRNNGIASSPITLPQQTLQRLKSTELYDGNHPSNEPVPSGYSSTPSNHMPLTLYQPHSRPPVPPPPINYGPQPPLPLASHPIDVRYGGFMANPIRSAIQYPPLQSHPRPLQPPPAAMTPGGSSVMPSYFNRAPAYAPHPPQPALLGIDSRNTPPITPFSANRHGPSEVYFNPSFEDGQVGFTGLKNLGNTCYMNSTLQCLSATIPLARFFKDGSYKRCINRTNPLGTQGLLAESVAELVRVLWGAQYTFVSPITFKDAICRFAPQFRGSDQQDAQEFLGFLLDGLHEDLNLVTNKPPPLEMTPEREAALETLPTQIASAKEWEIYKRRDNSVIVELFQGQYRSRLQCLTCNTTSTTYNTFMYLSLPIPNKRGISKVSLTQCLDAFLKEEIMEKDDAWNCPKCKTRRKATKRLSLAKLPPILLIHLKRFSFKGPFSDKLETFVQYPLYGLDLSSYVPPPLSPAALSNELKPVYEDVATRSSPESNIYDLYAVCNHFGSLSSGHYTAFARSQKDWYNIGDSRVSKTDEKSVKARSAYLLCFRRRG
ncbi:ubiquitin-specific protease doa4 [Puccinia graminis f. sp. tritici]|uniref:ubiquitinyl hydrolase 1 n=1 Tax=Puccinia graminis f. sp. tritici TaxID=56615 RepID=A0A5B0Q7C3_PUCGR|nr:ubiquitin-specific protease doa4 [Puccinia graminis f. sp. tritici]